MREIPELAEARAAWCNQPEEEIPVDIRRITGRRTRELFLTTRSEIMSSIGAALFFASVMAWRFASQRDGLLQLGFFAVAAWAVVTLFRFRNSIRDDSPGSGALARTGLEHYRTELLRRRDHLRCGWIWHGPLWLACMLSAATLASRIVPGRIRDALPVIFLLAGWTTFGIRRRLRQAAELQREIDEINCTSPIER
jgi:hypothetical protein